MAGKNPDTVYESFDFGIVNDAGIGSQELLEGLTGEASPDPDDIEEIDEEEEKKKKAAKALPKKGAKPVPVKKEEEEAEEDDEDGASLADQFADDEEEEVTEEVTEDEDEEEEEKKPAKKVAKKEEEEEDETDEESEDENEESEAKTPFKAIASELFRLGIFTPGEDEEEPEIDSPEQFLEQFQTEKKRGAAEIIENFLSKYGDEYREAFQAIFINGVSPQEYLSTYAQVETFKGLELAGNEAAQERVIRETLKQQGFELDDIDAEVERLKNYGDLETTSQRYHKMLVKREESRLQELSEKKAKEKENEERQDKAYQASITKILTDKARAKSFDGLPVTVKDAQDTLAYLSVKKYKTPSGELLTEFDRELLELKRPENHELRVKLALLLRNKLDLTRVQKAAVSSENKGLFSELAQKKVKKKGIAAAPAKKGKGGSISSWFNQQ
jgi:hypothetical protein